MRLRIWLPAICAAAGLACTSSTGTPLAGNVGVSVATQSPNTGALTAAGVVLPAALDDTITSGADSVIITSAQLVLRKIELKRVQTVDCNVEPRPADCEEIELGPVLVDLPLAPGAQRQFTVELPPGDYREIEFEVHKVSGDDPEDAAFRQQHPDFIDKSIRVQGTFNQVAFVFESDLDVDQELELDPPLTVGQAPISTNVTIFVDLDAWFRAGNGTLVGPGTANKGGPNENLVRDNIIRSMRAFEDPDEDGR